MKRFQKIGLSVLGVILVAQLIRPAIDNPPVVAEPHWNSKQTRDLVRGACFDCHSNETVVPWYGQVAPFRWLLASHVNEGREKMNFSDATNSEYELEEMAKEITTGGMPTWDYRLMHPKARLNKLQQDSLLAGLAATFGQSDSAEDRAVSPTGTSTTERQGEHEGKED